MVALQCDVESEHQYFLKAPKDENHYNSGGNQVEATRVQARLL